MSNKTPNDALRRLRRSYGFTQKEIANILGFKSRTQLSRVERGERTPRLEQLVRARILFRTPISELIPATWSRIVNGLWEDVHAACKHKSKAVCSEKCMFLTDVSHRLEKPELSNNY